MVKTLKKANQKHKFVDLNKQNVGNKIAKTAV